jgi:hypothetical protein
MISQFERAFGFRGISHSDLFRQGLGFMGARELQERNQERGNEEDAEDDPDGRVSRDDEETPMIPVDPNHPDHEQLLRQAYANERRLRRDLRAAGLI